MSADRMWSEDERRRVVRLCTLITGDAGAAEDLAQETLLEAWRIRDRLRDESGSRAWLDAVARNVCLRWRTRRYQQSAREVLSEAPADIIDPVDHAVDPLSEVLEREELVELLERALRLLPPGTGEVLVARYVEGWGPQQIASRLHTTPDAVTMRLTRGRSRLRELLETDLADEPLAHIWVSRHGVAWRPTRMVCAACGSATLSMRRDRIRSVLELRCDACDGGAVSSSWSLDNPALAPHLDAVRRPTAVVARMSEWSHGWWSAAVEKGSASCTRCAATVPVLPYVRAEMADPRTRFGWYAACPACRETLSASLLSLVLAQPQSRALRARRPRAHGVPTRRVEADGRTLLVVGLRDDASGEGAEVAFDAAPFEADARPAVAVAAR